MSSFRPGGTRAEDAKEVRRRTFDGQIAAWNELARVFNFFSLAVPGDSSSTSSTTEPKPNSDNEMRESRKPETEAVEKIFLDSRISQHTKGLSEIVEEVEEDFPECSEEENTRHFYSQAEASATVVALRRCGPEPRTPKRTGVKLSMVRSTLERIRQRVHSFSLAVPADFVPASPAPEAKPNNGNEMRAPARFENDSPEKKCAGARISLDTNDLSHGAGDAGTDFQEYEGGN